MKKLFLLLAAVVAMGTASMAQNAIGIRGAFGSGYGAELSYQKGLGSNRLELDLGFAGGENWSYINLTGVYQWTGTITGNFGWYAGAGANLGLYTGSNSDYEGFGLGVVGQIGADYTFKAAPFQISLDWRPMFGFIGHSGFGHGVALGIRYTF